MKMLVTALTLVFVQPSMVFADGVVSSCTHERAKEAETVVAQLKSWSTVFSAYRRFGECDDGAIAEGFTEAVTRMMATDWKSIPLLQGITSKDDNFSRFVIRHIDESADPNHLQVILESARAKCPRHSEQLCKQIEKRSAAAIDQLK